jgi:hypothetical protein
VGPHPPPMKKHNKENETSLYVIRKLDYNNHDKIKSHPREIKSTIIIRTTDKEEIKQNSLNSRPQSLLESSIRNSYNKVILW